MATSETMNADILENLQNVGAEGVLQFLTGLTPQAIEVALGGHKDSAYEKMGEKVGKAIKRRARKAGTALCKRDGAEVAEQGEKLSKQLRRLATIEQRKASGKRAWARRAYYNVRYLWD